MERFIEIQGIMEIRWVSDDPDYPAAEKEVTLPAQAVVAELTWWRAGEGEGNIPGEQWQVAVAEVAAGV